MLTKEQIEARFEIRVLDPIREVLRKQDRRPTLEDVARAWFTFLDICLESGEINRHQHKIWVLSKKYIDKYKK